MKKLMMFALFMIMISGCATVRMTEPLGRPLAKPLDPNAWNGTWLARGGLNKERTPLVVRVADATSGTLRMAWIEDEKDKFQMKTANLVVRQSGPWLVMSMSSLDPNDAGENGTPWWLVGIVKAGQGNGLIWAPNVKEFGEMVKAGKLPGTSRDENTVFLKKLKPAQQDMITSTTALFAWDSPAVLEKID
ncbi:hypothetical protein LLG95_05060 [bacterium]|nr:hypothetical protein [bacterium]